MVKLLKAFGCRILVADPYVQLSATDRADGVALVSLDQLMLESDVVTLHARVTAETTKFIGAAQFAAMKPGAIFVNTARGPMVDYDALYEALDSGHLGGAMLETFAVEPVPADWKLLQLPNVTHHAAHRRRLHPHHQHRRRGRGRGSAPLSSPASRR